MNRCENPHATLAEGALQHVQGPDALHQLSRRLRPLLTICPSANRFFQIDFSGLEY